MIKDLNTWKIDCIKNVTTDLSAEVSQTKDVLTEVDHPIGRLFGQDFRVKCFRFQMFI